jgi:hypothetical protein
MLKLVELYALADRQYPWTVRFLVKDSQTHLDNMASQLPFIYKQSGVQSILDE